MSKFFQKIIDSLFPLRCIMCKKDKFSLCPTCEKNLTKNNSPLPEKTCAKYSYKDLTTKNVLFKLKYKHHKDLSREMGVHSKEFVRENIIDKHNLHCKHYVMVPIPLSSRRLKERGYNQAEMIALGIDADKVLNIINRYRDTHKLKDTKSIDERQLELANSFDLSKEILYDYLENKNIKLEDLHVILIDDITTTGATFYRCKSVLAGHGVKQENIYCFALAH